MRLSKKVIRIHPNQMRFFCGFGLDWFGLWFFYWIGLILNPLLTTHISLLLDRPNLMKTYSTRISLLLNNEIL